MEQWKEMMLALGMRAPALVGAALSVTAIAAIGANAAVAQPAVALEATSPSGQAAPVFTRARLVSVEQEAGGKLYVRLKLLPRAKLPFTTQAFRVPDSALLAGIPAGAWVKFTARHVEGENTLTSIQVTEECKRFQPCD